jgi:hypothetical protein
VNKKLKKGCVGGEIGLEKRDRFRMYYLSREKLIFVLISHCIAVSEFFTFGVHWVAEWGGGELSNFTLSLKIKKFKFPFTSATVNPQA